MTQYSKAVVFIVIFLFLMADLCFSVESIDVPRIVIGNNEQVSLYLPDQMAITLKQFDPDFLISSMSDYPSIRVSYEYDPYYMPFAVIGDFNADSVLDLVVLGANKSASNKHKRILVLLSQGQSFEAVEVFVILDEMPQNSAMLFFVNLFKVPPDTYHSAYQVYDLNKDGFGVYVHSVDLPFVYYYENNAFSNFILTPGPGMF